MSVPTPLLFLNGRAPTALLERLKAHLSPEAGEHRSLIMAPPSLLPAAWMEPGALWAADGGANLLWKAGLPAAVVVGDLDSVWPEALRWHTEQGARVLERPDQERNDLEKALDELLRAGHGGCWVAAFEGGRLDMQLGLGTWLAPGRTPLLRLAGEEQCVLRLEPGKHQLDLAPDSLFSLVALEPCLLSLNGARWSGSDFWLEPGCHGVSNLATGHAVEIQVKEGWLLLAFSAPWSRP